MASPRLRKLLRARHADDVLPGDFVRRIGAKGVGLVENVTGNQALVAWDKDRRDLLAVWSLRRVKPRGASLDTRKVR